MRPRVGSRPQRERFQYGRGALGPPRLADGAASALGPDAALDADGRAVLSGMARSFDHRSALQGEQVAQVGRGQFGDPAFTGTDDLRRETTLRRGSWRRSSPRPCRRRRTSRTCTLRFCPIRKARSVAWSSTAGFHHRSTWTTWLARGQGEVRCRRPSATGRTATARRRSRGLEPPHHGVPFRAWPGRRAGDATSRPKRAARWARSMPPNSAYCG